MKYHLKTKSPRVPALFGFAGLLAILILAAIDRLYNIKNIGISGSDTFFYWNVARDWLDGKVTLSDHYRPLIYFIDAMGLKIWGVNDYSIKMLNSAGDLFNIVMVYLVSRTFLKNHAFNLLATAVYAFSGSPVTLARSELAHTFSTTAMLISFYFFALYAVAIKKRGCTAYLLVYLSGLFLSAAANMHPDLGICGLFYAVSIFVIVYRGSKNRCDYLNYLVNNTFLHLTLFCAGFSSIFILAIYYFGLRNVMVSIASGAVGMGLANGFDLIVVIRNIFIAFIKDNSSIFTTICFYISCLLMAVKIKLNKKDPAVNSLTLLLFSLYMLFCVTISSAFSVSRLFSPFIPLIIIFTLYWLNSFFEIYIGRRSIYLTAVFAVFMLVSGRDLPNIINEKYEISVYREVYDQLNHSVSENRALLITPFMIYQGAGRPGFKQRMYFGDNAVYLSDFNEGAFAEILHQKNIRYVFVSNVLYDERNLDKKGLQKKYTRLYMKSTSGYSYQDEAASIENMLREAGAKIIYQSSNGKIYML